MALYRSKFVTSCFLSSQNPTPLLCSVSGPFHGFLPISIARFCTDKLDIKFLLKLTQDDWSLDVAFVSTDPSPFYLFPSNLKDIIGDSSSGSWIISCLMESLDTGVGG